MAIRVLLADESTTIKKAFQLALSDFAVEVKSVPSGLDVLAVAQTFKPDIIFADVLLTKKSGYEVCREIRAHNELRKVPVILMWSGFMEFNTTLATQVGYTDKIEKPFDSGTLREKVEKFVVKTQNHPLKGLLQFPDMPDFDEGGTLRRQQAEYFINNKPTSPTLVNPTPPTTTNKAPTQISDEADEFQPVQLQPKTPTAGQSNPLPPQKLTPKEQMAPYQPAEPEEIDIQLETENYGDFEEVLLVSADKTENNLKDKINSQLKSYLENAPVAQNRAQNRGSGAAGSGAGGPMSRFDEQLMREEVRLMAEKICWQIIPEITEKIVREELNKLLRNIEKSI